MLHKRICVVRSKHDHFRILRSFFVLFRLISFFVFYTQVCEIIESPLFLKLNPMTKHSDVSTVIYDQGHSVGSPSRISRTHELLSLVDLHKPRPHLISLFCFPEATCQRLRVSYWYHQWRGKLPPMLETDKGLLWDYCACCGTWQIKPSTGFWLLNIIVICIVYCTSL